MYLETVTKTVPLSGRHSIAADMAMQINAKTAQIQEFSLIVDEKLLGDGLSFFSDRRTFFVLTRIKVELGEVT